MATILQYLVYGLQMGSVYALLALGYTMVYGIVGMINFAHGDFLMIGALGTYFISQAFNSYQVDGTYPMLIVGAHHIDCHGRHRRHRRGHRGHRLPSRCATSPA